MGKYYTDQERYEYCRRYMISGLTKQEFAERNGINRHTLSDWIRAYNNIHGKFINVSAVSEKENEITSKENYRVNILDEIEKEQKSSHFSRFDHSIVVIEYKEMKITTSLEQAEVLLEKILS